MFKIFFFFFVQSMNAAISVLFEFRRELIKFLLYRDSSRRRIIDQRLIESRKNLWKHGTERSKKERIWISAISIFFSAAISFLLRFVQRIIDQRLIESRERIWISFYFFSCNSRTAVFQRLNGIRNIFQFLQFLPDYVQIRIANHRGRAVENRGEMKKGGRATRTVK